MSVNIISRKFWNQLRNGKTFVTNPSDLTNFLLGSVCEKIKTETTIDVFWRSANTEYIDIFTKSTSGGTITITRQMNSFMTDGFAVNDTIFWRNNVTMNTGTGVVSFISALEMQLTSFTGTLADGTYNTTNSLEIFGTTSLTAAIIKYNLIENSEADSFVSKVDGNTISFAGSGLTATDTLLTPQGSFESWRDDGTVNVKTGTSGVTGYQRFIITHEFWITPFYLPIQYNDFQNGIAPDYLKNNCSLKYIANYEFRQSLYNPNISHSATDSTQLGDVSWFDEHFNGFQPIEFTKDSILYNSGGASALKLSGITYVTLEVNSANNLFSSGNTNFIVNLFLLPITDNEISNTLTTMFENYVFDQCFQTIGSAAQAGIKGIITNVVGSIVSNKLHVTFQTAFTPAQAALMQDHQYIISVITDDHTTTHATSKRVNVLIDYRSPEDLSGNNPSLINKSTTKFWEHPQDPTVPVTGTANYRGWITDGIYCESDLAINSGTLDFVKFKIVAENAATGNTFDLMLYNLDLSPYPIISGERIVSLTTTRGFKLITGSLRNLVSITQPLSNNYLFKFAFKLRFEDWVQLITADQDFINPALSNNGLSEKWSNYDDIFPAWTLKFIAQFTVNEIATGIPTVFNLKSDIKIHDYNEDGNTPALWSGSLETFDGAISMGVDNSAVYTTINDTKVVVTFTSINSLVGSTLYGIVYIGGYNIDGIYTQWQLSTKELPAANNWLKPLVGETKCKLTVLSSNSVKIEGLIDYTKVSGDISIYARIGYDCQDIAEVAASDSQTHKGYYTMFSYCRIFDVTIDSVPVVVGGLVPAPYALSDVLAAILAQSGGYIITAVPGLYAFGTATCTNPAGAGSSANGKIVEITTYDAGGSLLDTVTFTLAGGIDELVCPGILLPTNHILQENSAALLQENGDYLLLEI